MMTDDLENELRDLKFTHLTESELDAYCDQELDQIGRARVDAHVKQCFICERHLDLLREESAALSNRVITAEEVTFVERLMEETGLAQEPSAAGPSEITHEVPLQERLAEYLRPLVASWRIYFGQGALRGEADKGQEVWRWQIEDGKLRARAMMEKNADLTIHFSTNEMELEDARLHFRLGSFIQELTLQRISESEVAAQVTVPWQYRQGNMADMSIEVV
jgi:hypothetical protein